MLFQLYHGLGAGLYPLLRLLAPMIRARTGRYGYGFEQRLGRYPRTGGQFEPDAPVVWMHASSVGETQAAIILIHALQKGGDDLRIYLTSTTEQGNRMAQSRLPGVTCLMAPLDAPQSVRQALNTIQPDLYICLETELWPEMLTRLRRAGVPMLLLNGRLSERSYGRYRWIRPFMRELLAGFQAVAVISGADGRRFAGLGVPASRIEVCGNLKYDMPAEQPEEVRASCRRRLAVTEQKVFLCGSTHEGEEEMLLPVFRQLAACFPLVWVIAPRHLERVAAVAALLRRSGLGFDRLSQLGGKERSAAVVLVDTMGDLADLYSGGDYIFCGGSLVPRGGHNVMEAARWGRPVCFGPHMKDFRDAAELLTAGGGGFQVADAAALTTLLLDFHARFEAYHTACIRAATVAAGQRGAVECQARLVRERLAAGEKSARGSLFAPGSTGALHGCGYH